MRRQKSARRRDRRNLTVLPFPSNAFQRHLDALQVLALAKPKLAKAMIRLTATCARELTRSKTS